MNVSRPPILMLTRGTIGFDNHSHLFQGTPTTSSRVCGAAPGAWRFGTSRALMPSEGREGPRCWDVWPNVSNTTRCLFVWFFVCLFVCLFGRLVVCLFVCWFCFFVCLFVSFFLCLFVCVLVLSVCLIVGWFCLFVCLFVSLLAC